MFKKSCSILFLILMLYSNSVLLFASSEYYYFSTNRTTDDVIEALVYDYNTDYSIDGSAVYTTLTLEEICDLTNTELDVVNNFNTASTDLELAVDYGYSQETIDTLISKLELCSLELVKEYGVETPYEEINTELKTLYVAEVEEVEEQTLFEVAIDTVVGVFKIILWCVVFLGTMGSLIVAFLLV